MPRILVTGASGLIGRAAVPELAAAGFEVVALSRSGPVAGADRTIAADLLDVGAPASILRQTGPSHLLHLAWAGGRDRWGGAVNLDWVAATLTLVRAFAAAGGRRAVLAGSCAEYDWTAGEVFSEEAPLRPATLYGAAKAATGTLLSAAAPALGLSVAWARPFFVYGPGEGEGRLLGDLSAGLRAGRPVETTDGMQERDFLHSADLGRGLALLARSDLGGAVNLGSGRGTAVRDLILGAARILGREDLVRLGARPRPAGDPVRIVADAGRAARELGFTPRIGLAEGLADALGVAPSGRSAR